MVRLKHAFISKIANSSLLPAFLFIFISSVYFASSVGLMNSTDATQYFTSEALIQNHTIALDPFSRDPHYFVWPDIYTYKKQTLSVRGYFLNVITIPLHFISSAVKDLYNTVDFPDVVTRASNFRYELSVTSLFIFFSALGMLIFWKLNAEIIGNTVIASVVTLLTAFGTLVWKYSATYARHGFVVLLISLCSYFLWKWLCDKKRVIWMILFCLCWGVSFGIDTFLFIALTIYIVLYLAYLIWMGIILKQKKDLAPMKNIFIGLIIGSILIIINMIGNLHWYGTIFFSQQLRLSILIDNGLKGDESMISTPVFPTIYSVLFGAGKIPPESFRNYNSFPEKIYYISGVNYAKKYNFFGLFTVSPFLLFGIFSYLKLTKIEKDMVFFCLLIFILGVIMHTKYLFFWGGNQYDIRFFYPYTLFPAIMVSKGLKNIWIKYSKKNYINLILVLFAVSALFSVFMGWLGVINMFKPALTGERRIWADIYNAWYVLPKYSYKELLDATFLNRQNAWIGAGISSVLTLIFYSSKRVVALLTKKST